MQFEFEGNRYRIVFSYDRDRSWAAHRSHSVAFVYGPRKPLALYCVGCNLELSHLPKSHIKRKARCTLFLHNAGAWESIASGEGRVNLKAGDQFARKEGREAALTHALDAFTKARIAAIQDDVLAAELRQRAALTAKQFRVVAWARYNTRKQTAPRRTEAGGL